MKIEERLLNLVNFGVSIKRGTLWIVKDTLWEEVIPDFHRKRKGHPALSLGRKEPFCSLFDTISMMIGVSRKGGFPVSGVMENNRVTHFSCIRPCIRSQFPGVAGVAAKEFLGHQPRICVNKLKSILNEREMKEFDKFLKNRGLNI